MPRKLTVTARTIFPPPHKAQMVSEGESQGRHPDTGGGFTRKHDRRGPNGQPSCILDRQRRLPRTLRDHVRSASALSALKKSLVANLSAKRQLSVAKLSAKRIFLLAKRDFLVANGRMAADFSSPVSCLSKGLERLVREQLSSFLLERKALSDDQFGFLRACSAKMTTTFCFRKVAQSIGRATPCPCGFLE